MKVKFLLDWEDKARGDEAELEELLAADLLCDGVVERLTAKADEAPAPKMNKPAKADK